MLDLTEEIKVIPQVTHFTLVRKLISWAFLWSFAKWRWGGKEKGERGKGKGEKEKREKESIFQWDTLHREAKVLT